MIPAGLLRHRISLQAKAITRDELNAQVIAWAPTAYARIPANVAAISGREAHAADQIQNPSTLRVLIRVGPPVTNAMRVIWHAGVGDDRALQVDAVLPNDDPAFTTLLCSQGLNDGR